MPRDPPGGGHPRPPPLSGSRRTPWVLNRSLIRAIHPPRLLPPSVFDKEGHNCIEKCPKFRGGPGGGSTLPLEFYFIPTRQGIRDPPLPHSDHKKLSHPLRPSKPGRWYEKGPVRPKLSPPNSRQGCLSDRSHHIHLPVNDVSGWVEGVKGPLSSEAAGPRRCQGCLSDRSF